jgi:hypothetical protein
MYVSHNIEVRSRNHSFRGKAIIITYSECVSCLSYLTCKAHAPYYIVICGLPGIFPHYLINGIIFWNNLLKIKCVF